MHELQDTRARLEQMEARLVRLERHNRRLKGWLVGGLVLSVAMFLIGGIGGRPYRIVQAEGRQGMTVRTEGLVLVGPDGKKQAELDVESGQLRLAVYNPAGEKQATLVLTRAPSLILIDAQGHEVGRLGMPTTRPLGGHYQ